MCPMCSHHAWCARHDDKPCSCFVAATQGRTPSNPASGNRAQTQGKTRSEAVSDA